MTNIDIAPLRQPGLFERTLFLCAEIATAVDQARVACVQLEAARAAQNSSDMAAARGNIDIAIDQAKKLTDALDRQIAHHKQVASVGAAE